MKERIPLEAEQLVARVRERYARLGSGSGSGVDSGSGDGSGPEAVGAPGSCCTGSRGADADLIRQLGYVEHEVRAVPAEANLGLGCGAPVDLLKLRPGEVVLDLGSGGGLDALLAARLVGPGGRVIGVDMTPEMIARARRNAVRAGLDQVEFRTGRLESLPLDDGSVDAATSNCVINLVPDKARVFREVARVLRPGGRLVISDIVLDGELPRAIRQDVLAYVGCVAGALRRDRYFAAVAAAGLRNVALLRDVDFLALVGDRVPEELLGFTRRAGIAPEQLAGRVRSITFRADKPALP